MRKFLIALVFGLALASPARADASFVREVGRGCLIVGTILSGTTYIGATPFLVGTVSPFPAANLLLNNAVIGCGLGAAGAALGSIWAGIYDFIF